MKNAVHGSRAVGAARIPGPQTRSANRRRNLECSHAKRKLKKISACVSLELHLHSESEHYGALRSSAYVRVILNDRLQKKHRERVARTLLSANVFKI